MTARLAGAAALGIAIMLLLIAGGTPVSPALFFGLGAALFTSWRTIPGIGVAFGAMLGAALLAAPGAGAATGSLSSLLYPLELYGWLTALLTRHPNGARPSVRLLGAWTASSGCLVLGLALIDHAPAQAASSALLCVALAYRMGVIPAFGWGPLLLRHPSNRIALLGATGLLMSAATLVIALPRLPDQHIAHRTLLTLGAISIPYTAWRAHRQWTPDRRCALSYLAASGAGLLLLILGIW